MSNQAHIGALGGSREISQVAMVVRDVRATAAKYAAMLGVDIPPIMTLSEKSIASATYRGGPCQGGIQMACFYFRHNYGMELMQPDGRPSFWQECLDRYGEGVNHIAYDVRDMDSSIVKMEQLGYACLQRGYFDKGNGGYAYFDTYADMKVYIELLHHTDRDPFGSDLTSR